MPVPTLVTDLSTTLASNSPAGSDNVFPDLDNYLRALSAFIASIRDNSGNGWVSPYLPTSNAAMTGTPTAPTAAIDTNTTQIATTAFVIGQGYAKLASPTFTGTPGAPTASSGTNTTQVATTAFVQAALQALHPVGSVYINATNNTNPGTLLGFGTWVAFGAGRVPVGFDAGNALFDTAEETGGSADAIVVSHTHTATVTDPGHSHTVPAGGDSPGTDADYGLSGGGTIASNSATTGISVSNSTTGSSGINANYQPYITVYMWKRTA